MSRDWRVGCCSDVPGRIRSPYSPPKTEIRRQMVGGPSIVYHRLAEARKTPVGPDPDAETCTSVRGYDANGLYSFCLRSRMPVGPHIRWQIADVDRPDAFRAVTSHKYMACYYWLQYESDRRNCFIQHYLDTGYEINVGGYFLDGFSPDTNTAWEYMGCYSNTCRCLPPTNDQGEIKRRQKAAARTHLRLQFLSE